MAARGLILPPFHIRTRTTSAPPVACLSWISSRNVSCVRRARYRFFCSQPASLAQAMDMSEYRDKFAKNMAMAGLKPHHRIAMAVSGGPDSIALCVLTAGWKSENKDFVSNGRSKSIDGLLAIVVDHGLRTESSEEANLVYNRIIDMGIKCEVACCEWLEGRPQPGHLQEAARNKRYEILQNICIRRQIGVLLVAHHSDDQAELLILRLSRNSGVLGLAGMASTSQIFPKFPYCVEESKAVGIFMVRPLLEFSKEDMYSLVLQICRCGNQQWVEDPTNRSQLYARNRIRMSLHKVSSPLFKSELQTLISACRITRLHVDKLCHQLMAQAVTITPHGYVMIDLVILHSMDVKDICLSKFVTLVLQFVSQRHKPVRGSALKLLLCYLRTFPCKTCLTAASCYLCPAPGSKGTKVLVCCSVHPSLPLRMELFSLQSNEGQNCSLTSELQQILTESRANMYKFVPDASNVPFLDATSPESILNDAKRLGILSDSTHRNIVSLQKEESDIFKCNTQSFSDDESIDDTKSAGATQSNLIYPGQVAYFMDRFMLNWKSCNIDSYNTLSVDEYSSVKKLGAGAHYHCSSCIVGGEMVAEVRHMIDADWIYLSDLSKKINEEKSLPQHQAATSTEQMDGKRVVCLDHAVLSAHRALLSLKSIPVAARRALPVLVSDGGILLSIPSIGFSHCPHLLVSAVFNPRIPFGGGHTSFL